MIYCFDLDGTICSSVLNSNYSSAKPDITVVNQINYLYKMGGRIIIMTARGSVSKIDYTELTKQQLKDWGVNYDELIMGQKPNAHIYIDDRAMNVADWKKIIPQKNAIVAGAFDVIHPGYIQMFKEAKLNCTNLTVALHVDPSLERNKAKPIHTVEERLEILKAIKYIDNVILYYNEAELRDILCSGRYSMRLLGTDYIGKDYTGKDIPMEILWIDRTHNYSTTELKRKIVEVG